MANGRNGNGKLHPPVATVLRYLTPDTCTVHLGSYDTLHVTVEGDGTYGGVFTAYAFPVAHRDRYISLLWTSEEGEDLEIGIIRDLGEFPDDQADLIREALRRRYFIHTITKIHHVGWKYGFVAMDVETDKGPVSFMMRWRTHQAVSYGQRGKVLIDVNRNRYLIPDLDELSPRERKDFTRIIYW